MVTMDVKGITWVGHIYEKFEAMCLEVEEIMYQDTVKYVENHVQIVGESVKKFYSDVMQDLLPPSSVDSLKVPASDSSVERYSASGNCKWTKVGHGIDNLSPPSWGDSVKETSSELRSGTYSIGSVHNNANIHLEGNPENDKLSGAIGYVSGASSFSALLNENRRASCDKTAKISESSNGVEKVREHITDVSVDTASSDMRIPANSVGNERTEMRLPESDGLSEESNAVDIYTDNRVVFVRGSPLDSEVQHKEFASKEDFVSRPVDEDASIPVAYYSFLHVSFADISDDWSLDAIESSTLSEQGVESSQEFAKVTHEEACILVDGDVLHFIAQKEGKCRPYKLLLIGNIAQKKIQEAFSSRMRSARKQEYEQLADWYGYDGKSNDALAESSMLTFSVVDAKESASSDLIESEWELL
ncbi:hypothetical protein CJ030_MR6G013184 [Morella rubra]|uniref:Uncharacterized protein n=1 Tax=Morella rubra TaxID=262757 RepID=A0A6A1VAK3_9ROSI|nr:hypothetical protein CJ030_MR6G013184 [Morella rubra]